MITHNRVSAYTPSNMNPGLLKRIFVQREKLLAHIVHRLTTSMTTGDKHHILLVGPRGSGKTHLVSLTAWELKQNPQLSDTMRIAWLGEDDVFSGLVHFAFAIARSLADEYPAEFRADFKSGVRGLPRDDAALAVLNSVFQDLRHRHLLIITENLDQTFQGLGEMGQKKLRAFLQETRRIATLATSQQLFAGVSSRKEAFFGFFDTHHLEPLTVEDAQQLIRKIAVEQQKSELVQFLDSNPARYRIRALHHLAGGNYRMYVMLAEFLTRDTLDDLVEAFETLAEKMTPFFQERMRSLPDQQRQLVQCLCDAGGARTVKEIAEETFIAENICSKQLGNLKAKGYVRSERRGKESYYDMAEPLMRLCLEVKNQRGRPLKLVTRFLRAWFPEDQLQSSLKLIDGESRGAEYCKAALRSDDSFEAIINSKLTDEIDNELQAGRFHQARVLAEELSVSDLRTGLSYRVIASLNLADWASANTALTEFLNTTDASVADKALALFNRGVTYGKLGRLRAAVADYTAVIKISDMTADLRAKAFCNRGLTYGQLGESQAEITDYTAVIEMPDVAADQIAWALINRGATYYQLGDKRAALADCTGVIELTAASLDSKANAFVNRSVMHWRDRNWQASVADFESFLNLPETSSDLRTGVLFALPEPMVAIRPRQQVVAALARAFESGDQRSELYGPPPHDLLSMILERGPSEWADYVSAIAPLYIQHGVAEKLGQAVTRSIRLLDERDLSAIQLELWNQAWQDAGKGCEELQIPLACLEAAVEILKADVPTDRPLFRLPLEIRQLVRPLLRNTLPEV